MQLHMKYSHQSNPTYKGHVRNTSLLENLFLKTFSSVSLPWYATGVRVCVRAHACVCVCAFMLYALNFDNMYL